MLCVSIPHDPHLAITKKIVRMAFEDGVQMLHTSKSVEIWQRFGSVQKLDFAVFTALDTDVVSLWVRNEHELPTLGP